MKRSIVLLVPSVAGLAVAACGGSTATTSASSGTSTSTHASTSSGTTSSGSTSSSGGTGGTGSTASSSASSSSGGPPHAVTFSYTPAWKGVVSVDVVGGFNLATDWKTPLVSLTMASNGTWTGTAMVPAGQYPYLFHVVGDADASAPTTQARYAIDPGLSAFVQCPAGSPSAGKDPNPCSVVTVPQPPSDATHHVTGKVTYGGQPIGGYLVLLEREEPSSHHFFANRIDAASDGTFDLTAAAGAYRLQVLYPTFLSKSDAQRDPIASKALRRAISSPHMVMADTVFPTVEMEYLDYAALTPTVSATLPTTFALTVIAGATAAHAAVYGTNMGMGMNIGDPWWTSPNGTATQATFDGTFTTKQATETKVAVGEAYFWGTWQTLPGSTVATWQGESMVFPIKWK